MRLEVSQGDTVKYLDLSYVDPRAKVTAEAPEEPNVYRREAPSKNKARLFGTDLSTVSFGIDAKSESPSFTFARERAGLALYGAHRFTITIHLNPIHVYLPLIRG
jgi:hypothetical protein